MKASKKNYLPDHYESIDDLPVHNWQRICETNDYSYLLLQKKKLTGKMANALSQVWKKIYAEFIDVFGFSDDFISLQRKRLELARLQMKHVLSGNDKHLTFIEILEIQIKGLEASLGKGDFYQTKNAIEKQKGYQINPRETTVREFYSYLKSK